MNQTIGQIFRFVLVGGSTTLLFLVLGLIFQNVVGIAAVPASVLAYSLAAAVSFAGHRIVTFRSTAPPNKQGLRFVVVTAVGLGCSFALPFAAQLAGAPDWMGLVLVCLVIPPVNYLALRFLVFV